MPTAPRRESVRLGDLGQTTAEYAMLLAGLLTVVVLFVTLVKSGVLGDVVAALRARLLDLINSQ